MAAGGGMKQRGEGWCVEGGAVGGSHFMVDMRVRASYRRSPRLNLPYRASSTGARREPDGGPVGNPEREGRRGQGLHVAGHGLQRPSECSLPRAVRSRDGARGPDSEAARRSRRCARRTTPWSGTGRPNVLLSAGLDA
jgi:hypothetical protein